MVTPTRADTVNSIGRKQSTVSVMSAVFSVVCVHKQCHVVNVVRAVGQAKMIKSMIHKQGEIKALRLVLCNDGKYARVVSVPDVRS